jgi:hypothetical protein
MTRARARAVVPNQCSVASAHGRTVNSKAVLSPNRNPPAYTTEDQNESDCALGHSSSSNSPLFSMGEIGNGRSQLEKNRIHPSASADKSLAPLLSFRGGLGAAAAFTPRSGLKQSAANIHTATLAIAQGSLLMLDQSLNTFLHKPHRRCEYLLLIILIQNAG